MPSHNSWWGDFNTIMLVLRIPISPSPILQTLNIYKLKEKSLQSPISIYPRNISGYLKNIQSSKPSTIKKLHASIPLYCFSFESIRISAIFFCLCVSTLQTKINNPKYRLYHTQDRFRSFIAYWHYCYYFRVNRSECFSKKNWYIELIPRKVSTILWQMVIKLNVFPEMSILSQ